MGLVQDKDWNGAIKANSIYCYKQMVGHGFSAAAASGAIGNMLQENNMQTDISPGGVGIGQWTPESKAYTQGARIGLTPTQVKTLAGQVKMVCNADKIGQWQVPSNWDSSLTFSDFKKISSVSKATEAWLYHFEIADATAALLVQRQANAKLVYEKCHTMGGDSGTDLPSGTVTTEIEYLNMNIFRKKGLI